MANEMLTISINPTRALTIPHIDGVTVASMQHISTNFGLTQLIIPLTLILRVNAR